MNLEYISYMCLSTTIIAETDGQTDPFISDELLLYDCTHSTLVSSNFFQGIPVRGQVHLSFAIKKQHIKVLFSILSYRFVFVTNPTLACK